MRRVLLTGASGFVGRHAVAPLVARGFEVHGIARETPDDLAIPVVWHPCDLLDQATTDTVVRGIGASHLLHLAWCTEHPAYWTSPENLDWVAATLRLVRRFHAAGGERVVIGGTCAEYEWRDSCCDDRTPLNPASLYGAAKDATRRVVEAYAATERLSFAWGRIFFLFGPGERAERVVPAVARAVAAGERVACSSGEQIRDFLYVEDVASAFAALMDSPLEGCFDIGSGEGTALRDVLLELEQLAGQQGLVHLGEAPDRDEPASIVADARRLRKELGWRPEVALQEGLERTLAWWRASSVSELR
jgi:nucleoside-diphosphate-sugar epimerase